MDAKLFTDLYLYNPIIDRAAALAICNAILILGLNEVSLNSLRNQIIPCAKTLLGENNIAFSLLVTICQPNPLLKTT